LGGGDARSGTKDACGDNEVAEYSREGTVACTTGRLGNINDTAK
jgi:hypothetical protein